VYPGQNKNAPATSVSEVRKTENKCFFDTIKNVYLCNQNR
jgi:hypothetical protein